MPAHKRQVGVVFQNYALFPHLTVAGNVGFGLRAQGIGAAAAAPRVAEALALVRMSEFAERPVTALSGGQQQRVAVARALVVRPTLLLLDEPFSALDRKLRETMQVELKHLLREVGITAIFVTHDQEEALVVSDRIAVMRDGRIEQIGPPATIYDAPQTPFVAEFIGTMNRLSGHVVDRAAAEVAVGAAIVRADAARGLRTATHVLVLVRPELVNVELRDGTLGIGAVAGTVVSHTFLGATTRLRVASDAGELTADVGTARAAALPIGSAVACSFDAALARVLVLDHPGSSAVQARPAPGPVAAAAR